MDKLILCKKYPKHIHKIRKIFHNNEVYYELLLPQYGKNDKLLFEVNPFECNKCKSLFDIKKNLFKMIKIGIIQKLNIGISSRIIDNINKFYKDYVNIESEAIGNETLWYLHLCYNCSYNKESIN